MSEFVVPLKECSPEIKTEVCSTAETLKKIKTWLSEENLEGAKQKLGCSSESCVVANAVKSGVVPAAEMERFNPAGPWNSTTWLNNMNIYGVLQRYQKKFPKFYPFDFHMRDFAKHPGRYELPNYDWKAGEKQWDHWGCVLNTDVSSGSGEHWVAFFVDKPGKTVEYFDSAAKPPHPEFIDLIVSVANTLGFKEKSIITVKHQIHNTECGVYSLYYIISRLHGVPFSRFEIGSRIPDEDMVEFRKYLFRHS